MLTVTMRDENLRPRGQIRFSKVQAIFRANAPATFTADLSPEDLGKAARIKAGWGLVFQDENLKISGPITTIKKKFSRWHR